MQSVMLAIVVVIVLAYLFSQIAKIFKLPSVLGQLSAGFILSIPLLNGWVMPENAEPLFAFLADVGILLMFFIAGMELKFNIVSKNLKTMLSISIMNTIFPLVMGVLFAYFVFSLSAPESLIIGVALAVSSQAISYKILEECKMTGHKIATFIVGTGMIDDLTEFVLISIILLFFGFLTTTLEALLLGIILFIGIVILFKLYIIEFIIKHLAEEQRSQASYFMAAMVIIFIMAYFADIFGISAFIAAMLTGIMVKQILIKRSKEGFSGKSVSSTVKTAANGFFVPIFFVWVGMNTNIWNMDFSSIWLIIGLLCIDIFGTMAGTMLAMRQISKSMSEAVTVALGVLPKGDTEIALAAIALANGIIGEKLYSAIIVMAFMVTIISSILFRRMLILKREKGNGNNHLNGNLNKKNVQKKLVKA